MAKQHVRIVTKTKTVSTKKVRNSKTITDNRGRVHCSSCGAYIATKGKKK